MHDTACDVSAAAARHDPGCDVVSERHCTARNVLSDIEDTQTAQTGQWPGLSPEDQQQCSVMHYLVHYLVSCKFSCSTNSIMHYLVHNTAYDMQHDTAIRARKPERTRARMAAQ